jgi:hypothetical protein
MYISETYASGHFSYVMLGRFILVTTSDFKLIPLFSFPIIPPTQCPGARSRHCAMLSSPHQGRRNTRSLLPLFPLLYPGDDSSSHSSTTSTSPDANFAVPFSRVNALPPRARMSFPSAHAFHHALLSSLGRNFPKNCLFAAFVPQ